MSSGSETNSQGRQISNQANPDSEKNSKSSDNDSSEHGVKQQVVNNTKTVKRTFNTMSRPTQKSLAFFEEKRRQRRRLEFVFPRDDVTHGGCTFFFPQTESLPHANGTFSHEKEAEQAIGDSKEGKRSNGDSKRTEKRVLALLRLDDDVSKTTNSAGHPAAKVNVNNSEGRHLSGRSVEDAVRDKVGCRPRSNSTDGELNLPQRGLCDERTVLESHRWTMYGKRRELPPRGFLNLGNTCFLNSTLQCLAYLPPFCQSLLALTQSSPLPMPSQAPQHHNGSKKEPSSTGKRITWMLRTLFQQLHANKPTNGNNKSHGSSAIAPRAIVNALPSIGACGSRHGYKFRLGRQEDAHEFLVHLLDAMQDGELRAAGINQHVSGWRERLPVPRLDETTFVHRIFGGYLRSQVRCTSCGFLSNTYDPFLDLALEVSRPTSTSVAAALEEFTKKETLDSQNRWKCSGCHKYVCATKQLTVFRPPLALCIQLKRFSFGGYGGNNALGGAVWNRSGRLSGNKIFNHNVGGRGGCKISKPIEFPSDLNLPLSDGRKCEYSLTGVVIHVGGSASSGHYTAYVKRPDSNRGFQWFHMDDSFVEQVSEKQVLRQKDAYVLFYCRKEVKLEFPAPPKISMSTAEAKQLSRVRAKAASDRLDTNQFESIKIQTNSMDSGLSSANCESVASTMQCTSASSLSSSDNLRSRSDDHSSGLSQSSSLNSSKKSRLDPPGRTLAASKQSVSTRSRHSDSGSSDSASSTNVRGNDCRTIEPSSSSSVATSRSDYSERLEKYVGAETESAHALEKANETALTATPKASKQPHSPPENLEHFGTGNSHNNETGPLPEATKSLATAGKEEGLSSAPDDERSTSSASNSVSSTTNQLVVRENKVSVAPANSESFALDSDSVDSSRVGSVGASELSRTRKSGEGASLGRTRVVVDRGGAHGKLELILGPRSKGTAWKPDAHCRGKELELLGNRAVGRWDDDDSPRENDEGETKATTLSGVAQSSDEYRGQVLKQMEDIERSRKRKMHLDRWDAQLDQGKQKKVKGKHSGHIEDFSDPQKNVFQRIQTGLQRMNNGRAKGLFHRKKHPLRHGKSPRPPR